MITPDELKTLLKKHRWIVSMGTSGKQAVYAAKQRQGKKVVTRYIGTANRLNSLTSEDILAKLNRSAPARLADERSSNNDQAYTEQSQPSDRAYMPAPSIIPAVRTDAK